MTASAIPEAWWSTKKMDSCTSTVAEIESWLSMLVVLLSTTRG
jgi:hypothetical protein